MSSLVTRNITTRYWTCTTIFEAGTAAASLLVHHVTNEHLSARSDSRSIQSVRDNAYQVTNCRLGQLR